MSLFIDRRPMIATILPSIIGRPAACCLARMRSRRCPQKLKTMAHCTSNQRDNTQMSWAYPTMTYRMALTRAKSGEPARLTKVSPRVTSAPAPERDATCICLLCGAQSKIVTPAIEGNMFAAVARANDTSFEGPFVRCLRCWRSGGLINMADAGPRDRLTLASKIMTEWHENGFRPVAGDWAESQNDATFNVHKENSLTERIHEALMLGYEINRP